MSSEELFGIVILICFIFGLLTGKRRSPETGETCPVCKGKGQFRSGQWGGFWDTCIRCKGKGTV